MESGVFDDVVVRQNVAVGAQDKAGAGCGGLVLIAPWFVVIEVRMPTVELTFWAMAGVICLLVSIWAMLMMLLSRLPSAYDGRPVCSPRPCPCPSRRGDSESAAASPSRRRRARSSGTDAVIFAPVLPFFGRLRLGASACSTGLRGHCLHYAACCPCFNKTIIHR